MPFLPPSVPVSKRIIDLSLVLAGLLFILPIFTILTILVYCFHGRPIFFRQLRPGYKTKPFIIYKFRTMKDAYDEQGHLLPDDQRITKFGVFLRSFSLDELPEIYNVLKGEMSLVGPRPLLMQYIERYSKEQARRHDVLPGMTGWAQINGRNAITWADKFKFDVWYVDHWSLWLDIKIILATLWKAITREGINQPGHVTAEEFIGSDNNNN